MRPTRILTSLALAGALLLGGCGDGDDEDLETPTDPPTTPAPTAADATPTPAPTPTPTATATASPTTAAEGTYEVQSGDTLSGIAQQFGTTVQALAEANGITDPNSIIPGQMLQLPADATAG